MDVGEKNFIGGESDWWKTEEKIFKKGETKKLENWSQWREKFIKSLAEQVN